MVIIELSVTKITEPHFAREEETAEDAAVSLHKRSKTRAQGNRLNQTLALKTPQ